MGLAHALMTGGPRLLREATVVLLASLTSIILMLAGGACDAASKAAVGAANAQTTVMDPTSAAIASAHLAEPLVRTVPTTVAEDLALSRTLTDYASRSRSDDLSSLTSFLSRYPNSGWSAALWNDLGVSYLHDGYFSRAIEAWRAAWRLGRDAREPHARAMTDHAVGELARLYSSFGQFDKVAALFDEIGGRPVSGSATEAVQVAREELTLVTRDPRHLYNCGPVALRLLISAGNANDRRGDFLGSYRAGANGTNLAELGSLADRAGFVHRVVFRQPGQAVPFPAVVHWKVGHYGMILGEAHGRYQVQDLVFPGGGLWVTKAALDAESSGYFLVGVDAPANAGWRTVGAAEAAKVWGKGPTSGVQPGDAGDRNAMAAPVCGPCGGGMSAFDIKEAAVGVTISDTPVGYAPPIGPAAKVQITYSQREDSQPAVFGFFNVSPKWTLNWLTYVTDDPTAPGATVSRYLAGGGAYYYSGYSSATNRFTAQFDDGSILVLASAGPITYRRLLADGSVEIYAQSDGATSFPRNIFLSQVIDPQGNALTLNYDSMHRLTSLTDATGRVTTITYGVPGQPLLISLITDPFGRSAALTYDTFYRLASITDTIGLTSSFAYDANSLVDGLTTPYGLTSFAYTAPGSSGPPRFVQATDPLGNNVREEWLEPAPIPDSDPSGTVPVGMPLTLDNAYLSYRDSFYWDQNAYVVAGCTPTGGCDYTKARDSHFAHVPATAIKSTTLESIKYPLENRIWFAYAGQSLSAWAGAFNQPTVTGRVLDDGSTQLNQTIYDTAGFFKPTQAIDPAGRITTLTYANQIDLSAVSQTTANGVQTTLDQFTYNYQHRPIYHTDAAGQTTRYAYNGAGQVTSVTNPLGQTTTFAHNSTADLTAVTNANSVTAASYTYDAFDRVASFTDSEGWTLGYSYDAADRVTTVTYPDGTSRTYTYDKLDLASFQDRLGRKWTYSHDANRRLTAITDPAGHQRLFAYSPSGELTSWTDALGNVTHWAYDVEGRLTTKTYADASTLAYAYEATINRLHSVTDALSQVKQYAYSLDNLPTSVTYAGAVNPTANISFAYDPYFPRLTTMTDGTGTTGYAYGPVGAPGALQLTQETPPLSGVTIASAYDALGRLTSRTVAGSGAETFGYDAIGRLTTHGSDLGAFTPAYLGQTGQITSRSLSGSSLATTWSYLPNSGDRRLSGVSTTGLSSGQSTGFTFTTNAEDEITGASQTSDAAISYPPGSLTQTASYNTLNQLTNLSGQALTWDANGNLLSDGTLTYSWDAENRLVGIGYPGQPGKATAFVYDGLGRRVSVSNTPAGGGSAVLSSSVWCGPSMCQARNASGAVTKSYYAEGEFAPAGGVYYGPDQIGSVRRAFTASTSPAYDNDPYGVPLQTTAPATDFTYAGLVLNLDSGLLLATYRPYGSGVGRWLSRDPVGEVGDAAGNLYGYVGGDPLYKSDPRGLIKIPSGTTQEDYEDCHEECERHLGVDRCNQGNYYTNCMRDCLERKALDNQQSSRSQPPQIRHWQTQKLPWWVPLIPFLLPWPGNPVYLGA